MTLSTHVLDASIGRPAAGVAVRLERRAPDGTWASVAAGRTDTGGRLRFPGEVHRAGSAAGVWRITFGSGDYFAGRGVATFYPEVTVTFETTEAGEHHHVPLLLSPFAYSTYRGS